MKIEVERERITACIAMLDGAVKCVTPFGLKAMADDAKSLLADLLEAEAKEHMDAELAKLRDPGARPASGMSRRDWTAAMVFAALMSNVAITTTDLNILWDERAYVLTDRLIAEGEKGKGEE